MLEPYFFIYRLLLTVGHLNEHWQVRLHIEQDAGSFWISWLSFYHNFRGVIREAMQHFTSCYTFLKWQIAADLFSVRSRWENGAGSIIRRRKDRPRSAVCLDWNRKWSGFGSSLLGLSNKDWTAQWPTSMLWLFLQDTSFSKVHPLPRVYDWHLLITACASRISH